MIGQIRKTITPYYDKSTKSTRFKSRPALILKETNGDYIVLPISKIRFQKNVDPEYDLRIEVSKYPNLGLTVDSYIRTGKQTVINRAGIADEISNLKNEYPELFLSIVNKLEQFQLLMISELK